MWYSGRKAGDNDVTQFVLSKLRPCDIQQSGQSVTGLGFLILLTRKIRQTRQYQVHTIWGAFSTQHTCIYCIGRPLASPPQRMYAHMRQSTNTVPRS